MRFTPSEARFTHVITALCYVLPERRRAFAARCYAWVEPGGQLVLHEYRRSPGFHRLSDDARDLGLPVTEDVRDGDVALVTFRHE